MSASIYNSVAASGQMLPTLRFLTCGSVDDGKSTLIGRLLYESNSILDDHFSALERASRKHGTTGAEIDLALLVDGLEAEREQGITIDVAYRYFATQARSFRVADTPGHEQYTRNMATGASNSDLAVLLVDARKGLLQQTRRHAFIVSLLGIEHVILAVNKIDLLDYNESRFAEISSQFAEFAHPLGFKSAAAVPISARHGDNVCKLSANTPWYEGPCLLERLETIDVRRDLQGGGLRLPIQWVNRTDSELRAFCGAIVSGSVASGDEVVVTSTGKTVTVSRIITPRGEEASASAGDAVQLVLSEDVDISRGEVLSGPTYRPQIADQFACHLIWMSEDPLLPGRSYLMKIGTQLLPATITEIKHRVDVNTFERLAAKTLAINDIAVCNVSLSARIAIEAYKDCREMGAFILIDRMTNATAAVGMVDFVLRRATNIHAQNISVSKLERADVKHQRPGVIWMTGLSGAGKSTIANAVERTLFGRGRHTILLDGDNVRHGLNKNLGFTEADRVENIRRVGEVAKLMLDAGLLVICSFISPFRADRSYVRDLLDPGEFIEVFVSAPLELCIARDPKGLYKRALAGEIKNFTGVDQAYEKPERPEIVLDTSCGKPDELADDVVSFLEKHGFLKQAD